MTLFPMSRASSSSAGRCSEGDVTLLPMSPASSSSAGRHSDQGDVTLLPVSPAQPSSHPRTHRHGAAPGAPGPGHFSQHDEASSGDAAEGVDGFLCYFLTIHIELDLEVAHGHVHLAAGGKSRVGALWWDEGVSADSNPSVPSPDCCWHGWGVCNE